MRVRNLEFLRLGNCNLSRNKGFASISFLSSTNMIARADFVSPYFDNCSFSLHQQKLIGCSISQNFHTKKRMNLNSNWYRKFSNVKSCVISLNSSSLNVANTFKSFTNISTAFDRSCLHKISKQFQHEVKFLV